jgi:hypothetical protein
LINSDAVRNTFFKTTRSKNIITISDNFAEEKTGVKVLELLRKLKGTANPWLDDFSRFGAQATLTSLQAKDFQIKDSETKLREKDAQISSLEIDLKEKIVKIQQIERSIPMQIVNRYQRIVEKLLRRGTRRRHYYELVLTGIRGILNEGWRSFWNKFRHKI